MISRMTLLMLVSLCVAATTLAGSVRGNPRTSSTQDPIINASFTDRVVKPDERIELELNRSLRTAEGRLAVFIGTTDVTSLFARVGPENRRLRYNAKVWRLPLGESEMIVYLVSPENEWREAARFML